MYMDCLTIAAHLGMELPCEGCHHEHDRSDMISVDNLTIPDVWGCWELLKQIFIGKEYNVE